MIEQLSDQVFYGDVDAIKQSPRPFRSLINVAHNLRRHYWNAAGSLPHDIWTMRAALPDATYAPPSHLEAILRFADEAVRNDKAPILCHCRMGGHRGPSTALLVHWHLSGRNLEVFENTLAQLRSVSRCTENKRRRLYQESVFDYCRQNSIACQK